MTELILSRPVDTTSRAANETTDKQTQHERIYAYVKEHGSVTADDVDDDIFPGRDVAHRRFAEMRRLGMLRYHLDRTGERISYDTRAGKRAFAHIAVPREEWTADEGTRISLAATVGLIRALLAAVDGKDGAAAKAVIAQMRRAVGGE